MTHMAVVVKTVLGFQVGWWVNSPPFHFLEPISVVGLVDVHWGYGDF